MKNTYIDVMLQSMKKKDEVLDCIIQQNELQCKILEDPEGSSDDFDDTVEKKSNLIDQLEKLDSGFESLYQRVKEEIQEHKEDYADDIRKLQEYIRIVTDKSVQIQAQEARNKNLMTQKFARVKKQAHSMRANSKATAEYYKAMSNMGTSQPIFMDNKQ